MVACTLGYFPQSFQAIKIKYTVVFARSRMDNCFKTLLGKYKLLLYMHEMITKALNSRYAA